MRGRRLGRHGGAAVNRDHVAEGAVAVRMPLHPNAAFPGTTIGAGVNALATQ